MVHSAFTYSKIRIVLVAKRYERFHFERRRINCRIFRDLYQGKKEKIICFSIERNINYISKLIKEGYFCIAASQCLHILFHVHVYNPEMR